MKISINSIVLGLLSAVLTVSCAGSSVEPQRVYQTEVQPMVRVTAERTAIQVKSQHKGSKYSKKYRVVTERRPLMGVLKGLAAWTALSLAVTSAFFIQFIFNDPMLQILSVICFGGIIFVPFLIGMVSAFAGIWLLNSAVEDIWGRDVYVEEPDYDADIAPTKLMAVAD